MTEPLPRPVDALTPAEATLHGAAIETFVGALGGRDALLTTLLLAPADPAVEKVLRLLTDPDYQPYTLRQLCTLADLSLADFFLAYRRALLAQAHIEATRVIVDQVVGVVEDTMRRAQPHDAPCACAYPPLATCPFCRGTGTRRVYPDLDRQKVALELGELLQRKGPGLQQNFLTLPGGSGARGGFTGPGSFDALQASVQAILRPRPAVTVEAPPAVDATLVEESA